jgi:hypothetical protein
MIRKFWRRVSWPIVFAGLMAPFALHCGGAAPCIPGGPALPGGAAGSCPDMSKAEAIESFDFGKEFNLKADVAAKIKAGVSAAAEIQALNAKVDTDLGNACGSLAKDLGDTGSYKNGQDACNAALKAMEGIKAKLGAKAQIKLDVTEPHCGVDVNAYGDCAGHCDATVKPGSAEIKCEPGKLQGTCSGQCEGDCEASAAASCSGECSGSCDVAIKGSCSGNCVGKCDGKATPAGAGATCAGTCDGTCQGSVHAECKGKCGGSCHMKAKASCQGTCTGSCSVAMQAQKCTGKVEPPQMSAECKAKCDAHVSAHAECTPAHMALRIVGAADAKAEATFRTAIEKNLPGILAISLGAGKRIEELSGSVKVVFDGVQASIQGAGDPMTVAKLSGCVLAPVKAAADAAGSLQANVKVSVSVQASASASGSGHAG